jgi:hypothetical protein
LISQLTTLLAALVGLAIVALTAFWRPGMVLGLLIASTIIQEVTSIRIADMGTANQWVGVILFVVVMTRSLMERRLGPLVSPPVILLGLLGAMMTASFFLLSAGPDASLQDLNQFARGFSYLLICLLVVRKQEDLRWVFMGYLAGALFVASSGFFWTAILQPIEYLSEGARGGISGITTHYIDYAIRCMIPLPMILFLWVNRRDLKAWHSLLLLGSFLFLSAAALLSGSRGALLAFLFIVLLFLLISRLFLVRKVILITLCILIPFLLPIQELIDNLTSFLQRAAPLDASTVMRARMLEMLWQNLELKSILWGHGLENFVSLYSGNLAPHTMWGQLLFELGLIGFGVQVVLVVALAKRLSRLLGQVALGYRGDSILFTCGAGLSVLLLLFWGLYENIGYLNGFKHLFILTGAFFAGAGLCLAPPRREG